MADLADGQYELSYLGRSLIFGRGTPYNVRQLDLGAATADVGDYKQPRGDGIGFGRDYKGGRMLAWEGDLTTRRTPAQRAAGVTNRRLVLDALEALETVWDAEELRMTPGEVAVLRMRRGENTRRVYGRPRNLVPITGNTYQGWVPLGFEFQANDHNYYDDAEQVVDISMVPDEVGGLQGERIGPWDAADAGAGRTTVNIGGSKPAWMVFRVVGPIAGSLLDPVIEVVGHWSFQIKGAIRSDEFVVVDSTPWGPRGIRRNDGANWSGNLSTTSKRPSGMRVPPGPQTVLLKGTDPTLTSKVGVYWRDVFGSHA